MNERLNKRNTIVISKKLSYFSEIFPFSEIAVRENDSESVYPI